MRKAVFSIEEARRVAWETDVRTLALQLHQWARSGELFRLKRGLYVFSERVQDKTEMARALYAPAYISLESALSRHGLLPDVPFAMTLMTPKTTRTFDTPFGRFLYHHIRRDLFFGYDPQTLLASPEKALADYFYLYSGRLIASRDFWKEMRWQNLEGIDLKSAKAYAAKTGNKKVSKLMSSFADFVREEKQNGKNSKNRR